MVEQPRLLAVAVVEIPASESHPPREQMAVLCQGTVIVSNITSLRRHVLGLWLAGSQVWVVVSLLVLHEYLAARRACDLGPADASTCLAQVDQCTLSSSSDGQQQCSVRGGLVDSATISAAVAGFTGALQVFLWFGLLSIWCRHRPWCTASDSRYVESPLYWAFLAATAAAIAVLAVFQSILLAHPVWSTVTVIASVLLCVGSVVVLDAEVRQPNAGCLCGPSDSCRRRCCCDCP